MDFECVTMQCVADMIQCAAGHCQASTVYCIPVRLGWYAAHYITTTSSVLEQLNSQYTVCSNLASSPRPIFANFTERMTERNAKIGPGIHCRGVLVRMR